MQDNPNNRPDVIGEIVRALKVMNEDRPQIYTTGICSNLAHTHATCGGYASQKLVSDVLREAFTHWPDFSGVAYYPIPGEGYNSPQDQYDLSFVKGRLWSRDTEYGRQRWALLSWLIEYFGRRQCAST